VSHFTKVKTKIKSLARLKQVLKDLNYNYNEAEEQTALRIKGWNETEEQVLLEIETGCQYNVGVVLEEDTCQFVADWWGVETYTGVTQQDFIDKIMQKYAYNTVLDKITQKGYNIVTEEVDDKQNIRILIRKWE
jgi:hypothetical protein